MFLITGGGSGLGKELAWALAARGKSVLIVGRRESLLQEAAEAYPQIRTHCADLSTSLGLDSLRDEISDVAHIEGLIHNAGILEPLVSLKEIKEEEWLRVFKTNVDAPLFLTQKLYPKLVHGRVLMIGSGAAYFAIKGWAAYCVSKAALAMLTKCCQLEFDGVSFASVMPGIIDTQMQHIARTGLNMDVNQTEFYQQLKQNNRLISPKTVAQFLTWLLLDVDEKVYAAQEWDIYDTTHHAQWLRPPHQVPHWES